MPDYKAMYFTLFNAVTDAMNALKAAQLQGEAQFIEDEPALKIVEGKETAQAE